jgi:hypothetical protein
MFSIQEKSQRPHGIIRRLSRGDELVFADGPAADELNLLVCGYGAARGITGTDPGREYRVIDAVGTLFDYRRELLAPELTLRRLADYIHDDVRHRQGWRDHRVEPPGRHRCSARRPRRWLSGRVQLDHGPVRSRPAAGWLTPEGSIAGLVLIDEIEQHLPPELQTRVVTELTGTFPDVQFVLTTHSPLVALGADPRQLIVLNRDGDGLVTAANRVPDYRSYSPEDVLTDDRLFDVEAHNPEFAALLENYHTRAQVPPEARTEQDTEELRKVAEAVRTAPRPGYSEEELLSARDEIRALLDDDDLR